MCVVVGEGGLVAKMMLLAGGDWMDWRRDARFNFRVVRGKQYTDGGSNCRRRSRPLEELDLKEARAGTADCLSVLAASFKGTYLPKKVLST